MAPISALQYLTNVSRAHPVFSGKARLIPPFGYGFGSKFGNNFVAKLRHPIASAGVPATLAMHIVNIVFIRTKKEVYRITARRIVTAMAGYQSLGDGSDHQFPREAVRSESGVVKPELPVSAVSNAMAAISAPLPLPTTIWATAFIHAAPELSYSLGSKFLCLKSRLDGTWRGVLVSLFSHVGAYPYKVIST